MNGRKENAGWALAKLHCLAVTPKFFMTERCGSAVTPLRARSIHPFRQQSDGEKTHSHVNFTQKVFAFLQKHLSLQRSFNATRLSFRPISDSGERRLKTNLIQYICTTEDLHQRESPRLPRTRYSSLAAIWQVPTVAVQRGWPMRILVQCGARASVFTDAPTPYRPCRVGWKPSAPMSMSLSCLPRPIRSSLSSSHESAAA